MMEARISLFCFALMKFAQIWPAQGEESIIDFLILGPEIDITTKFLNEEASIVVKIDLSIVEVTTQLTILETLYTEWIKWTAIKDDTSLATLYYGMTSESAQNFIRLTKHLNQIVEFVQENSKEGANFPCQFLYQPLSLAMVVQDTSNIKTIYDSITKTWTSADIKEDLTKSNLIKHFCLTLTETMESWETNLKEMLGVLDSLASKQFPQILMGRYQEIDCIKDTTGEDIKILDCYYTKAAYICDIEIESPAETVAMNLMYPIHYRELRLRGENFHQKFAVIKATLEPKILDCDNYEFFSSDTAKCKIINMDKICLQGLLASNIRDSIKYCNFTKDSPPTGLRTFSGGILVQGENVKSKVIDSGSERVLATETPILIFSDKHILLEAEENFDFAPQSENTATGIRVIRSRLTQEDLDSLENKYYWENFQENIEVDDVLRYILLLLQGLSYPIIILGMIIGIKLRKRLAGMEKSPQYQNSRKRNFESNQTLLKRIKN